MQDSLRRVVNKEALSEYLEGMLIFDRAAQTLQRKRAHSAGATLGREVRVAPMYECSACPNWPKRCSR